MQPKLSKYKLNQAPPWAKSASIVGLTGQRKNNKF